MHKYFFVQQKKLALSQFQQISREYQISKKTVVELCKRLRESIQSFVSLFPKALRRDDSRLLVVMLKVIYFYFFGRFSKHNEAYFV